MFEVIYDWLASDTFDSSFSLYNNRMGAHDNF